MTKHLQEMLLDLFCDVTTPSGRERFLEFSHGTLSLAKTNLNKELQMTVDCLCLTCKFLVDVFDFQSPLWLLLLFLYNVFSKYYKIIQSQTDSQNHSSAGVFQTQEDRNCPQFSSPTEYNVLEVHYTKKIASSHAWL